MSSPRYSRTRRLVADLLCMPWTERIRASRMRETCTSGLKRAEAAGYTAPPLLDCSSVANLSPSSSVACFPHLHPWRIVRTESQRSEGFSLGRFSPISRLRLANGCACFEVFWRRPLHSKDCGGEPEIFPGRDLDVQSRSRDDDRTAGRPSASTSRVSSVTRASVGRAGRKGCFEPSRGETPGASGRRADTGSSRGTVSTVNCPAWGTLDRAAAGQSEECLHGARLAAAKTAATSSPARQGRAAS